MSGERAALAALAGAWGLQSAYRDMLGRLRVSPRESLLALVAALGAPVAGMADVASALALRRRQAWHQVLEPVVVAWDGRLASADLRLPSSVVAGEALAAALIDEGGEGESFRIDLPSVRIRGSESLDGTEFVAVRARVGRRLPLGYHRLRVAVGGVDHEALVIAAPRRAHRPPGALRWWGAFAPVYALRSAGSPGIGHLGDLAALRAWVGALGGDFVGTLPLFATFLDELFEPSPYSPVSRRYWNEALIDLAAVPEVAGGGAGAEPAGDRLVDYPAVAAAKRRVLEAAAERFHAGGDPGRRAAFEAWAAAHPDVEHYAAFRAASEALRVPWEQWPAAARSGNLTGIGTEAACRYHRYVQFVAAGQVAAGERHGPGLLLDMPLGVNPAGYDVWRDRESFVLGTKAGAPPDPANPKGQDWGNPPLHPDGIRRSGYAYPIACVRHLMAHCRLLRIDHVMGLHRLFVIPAGGGGPDGAYLRYRAEENYAILCLESHRAQTVVVGEDLGTVPGYVRRSMTGHHILRCHIASWAIPQDPSRGLAPVAPEMVASINTHDMAPYAAWWRGEDIRERQALGFVSQEQAAGDDRLRADERTRLVAALVAEGLLAPGESAEEDVLAAWLAFLAGSDAAAVLVGLEDLWCETGSQNIPGTVDQHPNWRRRVALPMEEMASAPRVVGTLKVIDARRHPGRSGDTGTTGPTGPTGSTGTEVHS